MASAAIGLALERIASHDKDFRYMGTSDLLNELQKETFKVDGETERKLVQVVLKQLDDASGDISGLAVKCLVPMVKRVNEQRVTEMADALMRKLLAGKEQQRDTASIALKTIIAEVPASNSASNSSAAISLSTSAASTHAVVTLLPSKLVDGVDAASSSIEVKLECLDILADFFHRFGPAMVGDHRRVLAVLLQQLQSTRAALRKRSIQCLASMASNMSDELLAEATKSILAQMQRPDIKKDLLRSNVQVLAALCRSVGYRFGPHLSAALPALLRFCHEATTESDDEIREYSLQALEMFVLRCPRDIAPFCESILDLALEFLSYDPNFTDDMEEDEDEEADENEDEDDEDEDEYSDDEDMSWKVRRAAAKCLSAIITSRPELLSILYHKACPRLIERFKEREENVKLDVFNAFIQLLHQTGLIVKAAPDDSSKSAREMLLAEVPGIVKSLNKQLKEKSVKTKVGVFLVLKELASVLPASLSDYIGVLVPGIVKALQEKSSNSNLKVEALIFTRLVVASHPPAVLQPQFKVLAPAVVATVSERYYKVTAEALRVCGEMMKAMRPLGQQESSFDFLPFVRPFFDAISKRLMDPDQDLEVKESAILCMGLLVSVFGDNLQSDLKKCLPLLLDRLRNEITRLTAVKALALIADSPLRVDISLVLDSVVEEFVTFLRKANRALRQASLISLSSFVSSYGADISVARYGGMVTELAQLISDADLALAVASLDVCVTIVTSQQQQAAVVDAVKQKALPQAVALVRSPLLQGSALKTLQSFFAAQVAASPAIFDSLLSSLLAAARSPAATGRKTAASASSSPASAAPSRQALSSIAQCAAVLCVAAGAAKCDSTVASLIENLAKPATTADQLHSHLLSLLCLGEIGKRIDLSSHASLETVIVSSFSSPSDEIKAAASFSLGSIAAGSHQKFLPFILQQIDSQPKLQYLLLNALKEVISGQVGAEGSNRAVQLKDGDRDKVLKLLSVHSESEEEGVRSVVAECLGKLALLEPPRLIPALQERTTSSSAFTRATVVTALKFTILTGLQPIDQFIAPTISSFLLMDDPDRHVRRAAVLLLSTAAHNKPSLITDLLPDLLPKLYDQMRVKKDMIRTVDLGPFKHTVDDGLELRKAAFDCIDTLLASCLHRVNAASFITPFLLSGLSDHYDVKMPCHLILSRLSEHSGPAVLSVLDALVEPLEKTVMNKTKQEAVKQEVDRNEDMIRSALRAVDALSRISNVETNLRFKSLISNISRNPSVAALFKQVRQEQRESATAGGVDLMELH